MESLLNFKDDLKSKLENLESCKKQLKSEFFGIDSIIDRLIDMVASWYAIPEIQEKPLVINLWGMSGIGKTTLIQRMVKLLQMGNKYLHFDLGKKLSTHRYREIGFRLEEAFNAHESPNLIFCFDEFHNARSINELGSEIDNDNARVIWEILGTGTITYSHIYYTIQEMRRYLNFLSNQLLRGYIVRDGHVMNDMEKFKFDHEASPRNYLSLTNDTSFLSTSVINDLFECVEDKYHSPIQLVDYLLTLDGNETIDFLKESIEAALEQKIIDCSKSLVFIIGNLDDAYQISGNFNPDINADLFYNETKDISLSKIKNVLKSRFRNEQIARLGNNHLIYPSLNEQAFMDIIKYELEKIKYSIIVKFNIELHFQESIITLLYKEGVYPTQGARPLFTTIDNIIRANIAKILYASIRRNIQFESAELSYKNTSLIVDYYSKGVKIADHDIPLTLLTENRRINNEDDQQAITAVHESGHAILMKTLLNRDPEYIITVSADSQSEGLTTSTLEKNTIISKDRIINENAVYIGGYVAEKLIFGEQNVTAGSIMDFEQATQFTLLMFKKAGLGSQVGNFDINKNLRLNDSDNEVDEEVKEMLKLALQKAEKVLKMNYSLLLNLADYLSRNNFMNKDLFLLFYTKYSEIDSSQKPIFSYREALRDEFNANKYEKIKPTGTDD